MTNKNITINLAHEINHTNVSLSNTVYLVSHSVYKRRNSGLDVFMYYLYVNMVCIYANILSSLCLNLFYIWIHRRRLHVGDLENRRRCWELRDEAEDRKRWKRQFITRACGRCHKYIDLLINSTIHFTHTLIGLTTSHEVAVSIPSTSTILNVS
jgi:hypothetical protein